MPLYFLSWLPQATPLANPPAPCPPPVLFPDWNVSLLIPLSHLGGGWREMCACVGRSDFYVAEIHPKPSPSTTGRWSLDICPWRNSHRLKDVPHLLLRWKMPSDSRLSSNSLSSRGPHSLWSRIYGHLNSSNNLEEELWTRFWRVRSYQNQRSISGIVKAFTVIT